MKREIKFPETPSYIYYNHNPKNRITGDCAFRAISLAMNIDYNITVMNMAQNMCDTGYAINDPKGIASFLKKSGWTKHKQIKHLDTGKKYTGEQFANFLSINYPNGEIGNVICNIGSHHIVCFKPTFHGDGFNCRYKCHDIWNSTKGCVGSWWTLDSVDMQES